jgi:hypothetical protein
MKLTIIGQQSNLLAEIDGSSASTFFDLSQWCPFFPRGQCAPAAFKTTLRQYATQTAPPAFMQTNNSKIAARNFVWNGFGIVELPTPQS